MKQTIVLLIFGGLLTLIISGYATGPAANGQGNLTGARGGGGCTCHNATSSIGTTVELDSAGVLVTTYHPGVSYTVKISATNNTGATLSHFGFQLSTVKSTNAGTTNATQGGTWGTLPANTHTTTTGSCSVVEHSTPLSATTGTGANGTTYVESVPWTAPTAGTGSIKIYGALNAVNFDNTSSGDNYQLASAVTITEAVAPVASVSISITSGSNPACANSTLTFTATPTNGGTAPTYQWEGNSTPIPGATSATETLPASSIPTGTIVTCVMTSNLSGVTGSPATSNSITMTINPVVTPSVTISTPNTTVCAGSSDTFTTVPTNGGTTPSYQWMIGTTNVGTNSPTFITNALTNGQSVSCVMTSSASCTSSSTATSNSISMTVNPTVTPSVSIRASATTICTGSTDTFTATPTNGGTPSYQWKVGTTNVGTNSPTFISSALTNAQVVTCVMTSTATCPSPAAVTSNPITIAVNPVVTPSVSIAATSTSICTGAADTFTATPVNGGSSPSYQWKINGTNAGTNSATFITNALTTGQAVTCVLTSNAPCATSNTATSNGITVAVGSQTPTITISPRSTSVCSGSPDTFTAVITNGGANPSYQWKVNGTNAGTNSSTFISSALSNGQTVTCVLTSSLACASPTTATSNSVTVNITALVTPTLTISTLHDTICQGTADTFAATGTNLGASPHYQWQITGANTGTNNPGFITSGLAPGSTVDCIVISNAACASPASATSNTISVVVHADPTVSITPSGPLTVCAGDSIQLTASGATSYLWTTTQSAAAIWVHSSGTFDVTGSVGACSSVATNAAVVTVSTPAIPTITQSGNILTSSSASGYQWILNGNALTGDSAHTLTITQTGNYSVITRNANGCYAQSATAQYTYVNGIASIGSDLGVKLYPVPNQGSFMIEGTDISGADLAIYDIYGQNLYEQKLNSDHTQISNINLSAAMYFVTISDRGRTETIKMQVTKE